MLGLWFWFVLFGLELGEWCVVSYLVCLDVCGCFVVGLFSFMFIDLFGMGEYWCLFIVCDEFIVIFCVVVLLLILLVGDWIGFGDIWLWVVVVFGEDDVMICEYC